MESNGIPTDKIKKIYQKYEANDEIKALELIKKGTSLKEIKVIYPNFEQK